MVSLLYTIACVFVSLCAWPIILISTAGILLLRLVLCLIFYYFHNGKFTLMSPSDTFYAFEERPHVHHTITTGILVKRRFGSKALAALRLKCSSFLNNPVNHKLLCCPVKKFGFHCWEDVRDSFQLEEHIKVCPGSENGDKVLSRAEFNKFITNLATSPFPTSKPKWEVLVMPRVDYKDLSDEDNYTAILIRHCHSYVDATWAAAAFRSLAGEPEDSHEWMSTNTTGISPPTLSSQWFETLLNFPMETLQNVVWGKHPNADWFMSGNRCPSEQFYARSTMKLSNDTVTQVRKKLGCSTEGIFLSALCASAIDLAKRKELELPKVLRIPSTRALPCPDRRPQNRLSAAVYHFPVEENMTSAERLQSVMKTLRNVNKRQVLYTFLLQRLLGLWPATVVHRILMSVDEGLTISIVPSMGQLNTCEGQSVEDLFHLQAPSPVYRTIATIFVDVNGQSTTTLFAKKSALVECTKDLEEMLARFETAVKNMVALAEREKRAVE